METERQSKLERLAEAINHLPDDKADYIIGYADAVADMMKTREKDAEKEVVA